MVRGRELEDIFLPGEEAPMTKAGSLEKVVDGTLASLNLAVDDLNPMLAARAHGDE